jgi:hypothetical protein
MAGNKSSAFWISVPVTFAGRRITTGNGSTATILEELPKAGLAAIKKPRNKQIPATTF